MKVCKEINLPDAKADSVEPSTKAVQREKAKLIK